MSATPGNLLLVGAGGFVGPWLARSALAAGWSVTGISRHVTESYGQHYTHVLADAADLPAYQSCVEQAQAVIFNAAYIPVDYADAMEASVCLRCNALAPLALLDLIANRPRPFIYISGGQGYQTAGEPAAECDRLFPAGHAAYYLASKLLGDVYTEHYRLVHGVPTSVLRAGSVYGPGQIRGMISHFVQQARAGRRITLQDGGRYQVDLTYVGDVGRAAVAALARNAVGIFNIGSGRRTSALDAARLILAAAGRTEELLEILPAAGAAPPSGFTALDIARAGRELGFVPTLAADGLALTVREWR